MWQAGKTAALKKRYELIVHARSFFRPPSPDSKGFRCMRVDEVIGWRHDLYPAAIAYGDTLGFGYGLQTAAALGQQDPQALGYAQQCLANNQFLRSLKSLIGMTWHYGPRTALSVPAWYAKAKALPPSHYRLPAPNSGHISAGPISTACASVVI